MLYKGCRLMVTCMQDHMTWVQSPVLPKRKRGEMSIPVPPSHESSFLGLAGTCISEHLCRALRVSLKWDAESSGPQGKVETGFWLQAKKTAPKPSCGTRPQLSLSFPRVSDPGPKPSPMLGSGKAPKARIFMSRPAGKKHNRTHHPSKLLHHLLSPTTALSLSLGDRNEGRSWMMPSDVAENKVHCTISGGLPPSPPLNCLFTPYFWGTHLSSDIL